MKKWLLIALSLTAVTSTSNAEERKPIKIDGSVRLETAECNDKDDWYLDGYGVMRKEPAKAKEFLQKRLEICKNRTMSDVPQEFIEEWYKGGRSL
jgi:hypothetical protein